MDDNEMDQEVDGDAEMEEDDEEESSASEEEVDEEHEAAKLQQLQDAVTADPFDYDSHTLLINQAKKCAELDILRAARQRMSEIFPLTSELWRSWIADETRLHDKDNQNEVAAIVSLYERAVKDYWSVELWQNYALFITEDFSSEEAIAPVRKVFERALEEMRYHTTEGKQLWDDYRAMEQAYLAALAAAAEQSEEAKLLYEKQRQNVLSLFKRQLRCPLIGIEDTYKEFLDFVGGNPDAETEANFNKAKKQLEEMLPFELQLVEADDSNRYRVFMAYIDHESTAKRSGRAIVTLFERAMVNYCLSSELWSRYLYYIDRQMRPACSATQSLATHERSVRNIPWSFELWISYFRAAELHKADDTFMKSLFLRIKGEICSLPSQVVDIWLAYLSFLKRKLISSPLSDTIDHPHVLDLRRAFAEALAELQEMDVEKRIERYWATVEAETLDNLAKGRDLWESVMKSFQHSSKLWLEYISFERRYGDDKSCRKVLASCMRRNLDDQEAVVQKWSEFELEAGTIETLMDMQDTCRTSLKRIADRLAKLEKVRLQEEAKQSAPRKNFRNRPDVEDEEERPERAKRQHAREEDGQDGKRKRAEDVPKAAHPNGGEFKVPDIPLKPPSGTSLPNGALASAAHTRKLTFSPLEPVGAKTERTVILKNLNYDVKEEAIFDFFTPIGEIKDIRFAKDARKKNVSRGFCYVEFVKADSVAKAVAMDRQELAGRPVFIEKEGQRENFYRGCGPGETRNKLFVKNLHANVTEPQLMDIFSKVCHRHSYAVAQ
ncbi:hypothetical protein RvY_13836-2 [Ramazzottius varieornatus]|uniref:RRM domain-containing protein n=1 Tax=Ramazzottius varieornatus TaxID=947166 RepID=A0A1D1VXR9_RAMVA|nr:hypothetical protein RvY_13836-2 [Ramazzottius varieornatus]